DRRARGRADAAAVVVDQDDVVARHLTRDGREGAVGPPRGVLLRRPPGRAGQDGVRAGLEHVTSSGFADDDVAGSVLDRNPGRATCRPETGRSETRRSEERRVGKERRYPKSAHLERNMKGINIVRQNSTAMCTETN